MSLPPQLLEALAAPNGGRVVLVVGAGCSFEPPTQLPLSRECSQDAHRKLIADGVLAQGECSNPDDLSVLADTIKTKTGGQGALVSRLPVAKFKSAKPNDGHLIAAALMLEGAISNVVTLNFDLAFNHALSVVGADAEVSIVKGPEEHGSLSRSNVIYLHRNVEADPEQWILTTSALNQEWKDSWEEVIARFATAAPVTVFAGLGSPCGVLTESVGKIQCALGDSACFYLAGPDAHDKSQFARDHHISEEKYVQLGWVDLMRQMADRMVKEMGESLARACNDFLRSEGWDSEDVDSLCLRVTRLGLVNMGRVRACWLLEHRAYAKADPAQTSLIADLLLAIGLLERATEGTATIRADGLVELQSGSLRSTIRLASGRGIRRWASLEAELLQFEKYSTESSQLASSRIVLVSGVTGNRVPTVPPASIIGSIETDSILNSEASITMVDVDYIRSSSDKIRELLG